MLGRRAGAARRRVRVAVVVRRADILFVVFVCFCCWLLFGGGYQFPVGRLLVVLLLLRRGTSRFLSSITSFDVVEETQIPQFPNLKSVSLPRGVNVVNLGSSGRRERDIPSPTLIHPTMCLFVLDPPYCARPISSLSSSEPMSTTTIYMRGLAGGRGGE